MSAHLVGIDIIAGVIVVLRTGQDGGASRQVDLLTPDEAERLIKDIRTARMALLTGVQANVPTIRKNPEPEQVALFDLGTQ